MDAAQQDRATKLIQQIGSALVADPRYAGRDWDGIAVVAIIEPGVRRVSGYTFDAAGEAEAGTPRNRAIDSLFAELQEATQIADKGPWKSALFQIKRAGMRFAIDFEYDDPMRWKVDPDRMDEILAAIRPR